MKKLLLLLALMGMVAVGCSKEQSNEEEGGNENDIPENIFCGLDKESATISPDGGSVDILVYSNYKWEISGISDWCTPSVKTGNANEDGQKVTFSADMTYDDREATFWFRCADEKIKFVVSQKSKKVIISDANNTFNIPAEGGIAVISYKTTVDCEVIIPEEAKDWITFAPATRGLVSESITLVVAENTTYSARSTLIKVVSKDNPDLVVEYTINQEQNNALLADENNSFTVPSEGGEVVIEYQTNVDCEVIIPEEAKDWITFAPATRGLVSESITLVVAENTTYSARSTLIKVISKDNPDLVVEYTINQEQNNALLADENNTITVPSTGGEVVIKYQTNVNCEVVIPEEAQDWVSIAPATRGLVSESITLVVAENTTYSARSTLIKVVSKDNPDIVVEYTINQEQNNALLADENNTITVPSTGGEVVIKYQTNVDCEVIIPEEAKDWITFAPATRGLVTYNTTLNITANNSGKLRSSVVKVISRDHNELFAEYTIAQNTRYCLYYTSNNGKIVKLNNSSFFDAGVLSNTYKNGVGEIEFNVPLTTIGAYAFDGCSSLTSVTIPDGVTTIEYAAFRNCNSLTSITIPDSVTEIYNQTFRNCSSLTSVNIPDNVIEIGDYAFSGCSSLTSVNIGNSVTTIGHGAFRYCISLQEFDGKFASADGRCLIIDNVLNSFAPAGITKYAIPNSVTEIKTSALEGCSSLTSITIPNSVTTIETSAFYGCSGLTSITIPNGVTTIEQQAFYNCGSVKSVTIGKSVEKIEDSAFYGCTGELNINSKIIETSNTSHPDWLKGTKFTKLTIGESVEKIGNSAFYGCSDLTSLTISNSVTAIGEQAFYNCSSLKSATIGESVEKIGNSAFYGCSGLTSITIPNSVTTLGEQAFYNCSSLKSATIGESVEKIGNSAFYGCSGLTSITIPNSVTAIGEEAFYNCSSLKSATIGESVEKIGDCAFYSCSSLLSVDITDIAAWCQISFMGAYSNPLHVAGALFLNDKKVTNLIIPDSVTHISSGAFRNCFTITTVTIGNSVTSIGDSAFSNCSSLTSVTIGESVTSIGSAAFYYCSSLQKIYCKPITPPKCGSQMLYATAKKSICVPRESLGAYHSANYWSDYASHIYSYDF